MRLETLASVFKDVRARILQPFVTAKTLLRGMRLGLFTADAILREHGDRLSIDESKALGGAKISLWFPVFEEN